MKQSTCFILVLLLVAISCSPKATPTPTVVPPTQGPQLTAEQVVGLVADYLLREATQSQKASAFSFVQQAKAEYTGDGVWKVTTGTLKAGVFSGDVYWFCFESTQKVVPGSKSAQYLLYMLKGGQ